MADRDWELEYETQKARAGYAEKLLDRLRTELGRSRAEVERLRVTLEGVNRAHVADVELTHELEEQRDAARAEVKESKVSAFAWIVELKQERALADLLAGALRFAKDCLRVTNHPAGSDTSLTSIDTSLAAYDDARGAARKETDDD